jgi:WD40 repeat protein
MSLDEGGSGMQPELMKSDLESAQDEEARIIKLFKQIDKDGSGSIDAEELQDAMRLMGVKCTANSAKKVLKVIDTDGSGEIDQEEFLVFFQKVKDPEEIKNLLSAENQKFMDYKAQVQNDPNFTKKFYMPETYDMKTKFADHGDNVEAVEWLEGSQFVTASLVGLIFMHDVKKDPMVKGGVNTKPIKRIKVSDSGVYGMKVAPTSKKFAACAIGTTTDNVLWVDLMDESKEPIVHEGHETTPFCITVSLDDKYILSGNKQGAVILHQVGQKKPIFKDTKHEKVCSGVAFDLSGTKFATTSFDGMVYVYSFSGKDCFITKTIEDAAATGMCFGVQFVADDMLLSCGDDFCVKLWDLNTLDDSKMNFFGHTSDIKRIALSPDNGPKQPYGLYMLSGAADGSVRIWVVKERDMLSAECQKKIKATKAYAAQIKRNKANEEAQEKAIERMEAAVEVAASRKSIISRKGGGDLGMLDGEEESQPNTARDVVDPEEKLQKVTEDLEDLNAMLKERDTMSCLQARCAVEGHKLGITGMAMRFVDEKTVQVLTTGQDQCCKLYEIPVPDPKVFRRWALDVVSARPSKDGLQPRKSKQYVNAEDNA